MEQYITPQDLQPILNQLDEISKKLSQKEKSIQWLDNSELLQLLHISRRTAQNYRDSGLLSFSIIGNKIYYRLDDIEEMLSKHYKKAFK